MEDRCVICGAVVPEGRQVCPACEAGEITAIKNKPRKGFGLTVKELIEGLQKYNQDARVYTKEDPRDDPMVIRTLDVEEDVFGGTAVVVIHL